MKTISAKFERADKRVKLGGGWYLCCASPLMQPPADKHCGLLPSDVVYYRRRRAVVKAIDGDNVFLDRPLVVSRSRYNATPSVHVWSELKAVGR